MTTINCTVTASDDNNLILETRGRVRQTKVIPRNDEAPAKLFAYVEEALKANARPERPAFSTVPPPAAPADEPTPAPAS